TVIINVVTDARPARHKNVEVLVIERRGDAHDIISIRAVVAVLVQLVADNATSFTGAIHVQPFDGSSTCIIYLLEYKERVPRITDIVILDGVTNATGNTADVITLEVRIIRRRKLGDLV